MKTIGRSRIQCLLLVAAFAMAGAVCAAETAQSSTTRGEKTQLISEQTIYNLDRVTPDLWRGSAPSAEGLAMLSKAGVKTIVDLRMHVGDDEEAQAKALGMNYVRIPMGYFGPSREAIGTFLKVVTNSENGPVFIHCRKGEDRTGTLVGVYRRVIQRWPFEKVYSEMRQHHFKPWLFAMKESVEEACKNYDDAFKSVSATRLPHSSNEHEPDAVAVDRISHKHPASEPTN